MSGSKYECQPPDLHSKPKKFYGKYRGTVVGNDDPNKMGRIQALVPDVADDSLSWAMPCLPLGGNGMGIFAVPPIGAGVWIEFEQGDPDYPIWVGCFWGANELPSPAKSERQPFPGITLVTEEENGAQCIIVISNEEGIKLQRTSEKITASIIINANGIKIENGQDAIIELTGPSVKINQNALEIT